MPIDPPTASPTLRDAPSGAQARSAPIDPPTPAMRQYVEQKARVGDAILLFRMGDFYETFYDDAVLCSKLLGIALTSRSKGDNPIPLAGIPYHALDAYLRKLVAAGHKVAISEQLEDAKQAKGVVRRDVVRVVTAGTLTETALLKEQDDNILAAVCWKKSDIGLALVELVGGRLEVLDVTAETLLDELIRLRPAELLIAEEESMAGSLPEQLRAVCGTAVTRRPAHEFAAYQAEQSLLNHFGVASLSGFGFEEVDAGVCAAGPIVQYLYETQKSDLRHISTIKRRMSREFVLIDGNTFRALEIERTLRGNQREGSLLYALDRTVHPIGGRTLKRWLCFPLRSVQDVLERQDSVAHFVDNYGARSRCRELLRRMSDVERIAARAALGRASPQDLAGLSQTLTVLPALAETVRGAPTAILDRLAADLTGLEDLANLLKRAIRDDPAPGLREGGIISAGFDAELDRLCAIGRDGQIWLADYQRREIERTGLGALKVGFNRVFGYYIEIPRSLRDKAPAEWVRRQTVKNAERFITDELKRFETEALTAEERANQREFELFEQVRAQVVERTAALLCAAQAIGTIDCFAALAELAVERRYVRPQFISDWGLEIRDGRHPVLDQTLGEAFVPNDTVMAPADARALVITGPNMAGKSTFIRQVALLTLMAHTGSFVPAKAMSLSPVDRIFARVGSSDELARGRSTFMVEMAEAANILHHASSASLVVLDELGRGTSTFDGLSLAWAIIEHLVNEVKCRALIATHYHELTELERLLRGVRNYNVAVRESASSRNSEERIVFLHRIIEGGASKSYGIQVARLAGIPPAVIQRGREVLEELERGFARESRTPQFSRKRTKTDEQLMLFRDPGEAMIEELSALDRDRTTPAEALQKIREWMDRYAR